MVSELKKSYSVISEAANFIRTNNGGSIAGACPTNDHVCLANLFKTYLKVNKYCPQDGSTGCWHAANSWYDISNTPYALSPTARPNMVLSDGSLLMFWMGNSNCSYTPGTTYKTTDLCAAITVDVNGFKKPNTAGKDIFVIIIQAYSTLPQGSPVIMQPVATSNTCVANSSNGVLPDGTQCAYYYLNVYND